MPNSSTITVRLSDELKTGLEKLAQSTKRSRSFLAAEAIADYVEVNSWQVAEVEKAVKEADAGDFADDDHVAATLSRLSQPPE
jgi:predicted transcriptional regulator